MTGVGEKFKGRRIGQRGTRRPSVASSQRVDGMVFQSKSPKSRGDHGIDRRAGGECRLSVNIKV